MGADMWTPPAAWTYTPPDWTAPPDHEELWIEARVVDPMASLEADMEHGIFAPRGQRRPELFVMLPGSGGRPRNNKKILQTAARAGYISIGLAYPTELSSSDACDGSPDKDCQEKFRREKLHAEPQLDIIRGGTDGSLLTERGLPTPNLSSGQHNPHSPLEWTSLEEMESAVAILVQLAMAWVGLGFSVRRLSEAVDAAVVRLPCHRGLRAL